eukprot:CAMPEP_0184317022 /NCGR_PEP_ID=MMETSP1049-20130417/94023_1 /TAXON_ID=77928 /ORGANISM="Proteomonas sulcata, Strain CCMP704" /LENGTH=143 /DNA_ID=CAMNT_0026636243 /DNA_START=1 /DNA_END=429 /DNA_ORIENTATION=+
MECHAVAVVLVGCMVVLVTCCLCVCCLGGLLLLRKTHLRERSSNAWLTTHQSELDQVRRERDEAKRKVLELAPVLTGQVDTVGTPMALTASDAGRPELENKTEPNGENGEDFGTLVIHEPESATGKAGFRTQGRKMLSETIAA